jgi:hypothetical protein
VSNLSTKLTALHKPSHPSSIASWFAGISEEDSRAVWEALRDGEIKTHSLYWILRDEGMRCSRDSFTRFRNDVLAGSVSEEDFK